MTNVLFTKIRTNGTKGFNDKLEGTAQTFNLDLHK